MRSDQGELYETSCADIWLTGTPLKPWTCAIWRNGGHTCLGHVTSIKSNLFFLISGHISTVPAPSVLFFFSFLPTNVWILNNRSKVEGDRFSGNVVLGVFVCVRCVCVGGRLIKLISRTKWCSVFDKCTLSDLQGSIMEQFVVGSLGKMRTGVQSHVLESLFLLFLHFFQPVFR